MSTLIVLENPQNWALDVPAVQVVAAREYLTDPRFSELKGAKVLNLCRTYSFQTTGYYVSLLAAARGHQPMPSVSTLQDLRLSPVVRVVSEELEEQLERAFRAVPGKEHTLRIYFGAVKEGPQRLARALFNFLPAPMLQADFENDDGWRLVNVKPIATSEIPPEDRPFVAAQLARHFQRRTQRGPSFKAARYDLAILIDPKEIDSPSDERAIGLFIKAARELEIDAETIESDELGRLAEYDALFVRATTAVDHFTYRFARQAEALGLVVIDAPRAILQATNKVYQAELFARHGLPTPRTRLMHRDNVEQVIDEFSFPVVLKRPDSSFSLGVKKADDRKQLDALLADFFKSSDLVVAQEFVPSEFDWRIGVLDRRFLFGCKYFMAAGHWQIQKSGQGKWRRFGKVECFARENIPEQAVDLGVRAASVMGDGLFGVDVKEVGGRFVIMEVNDNPSIEAGVEDGVIGEELYRAVMRSFLERLERRGREQERRA